MLQSKTRVPPKLFAIKEESFSLLAREDRAPQLPKRKVLYLILGKKRLRASSNVMRQKRVPSPFQ